MSKFKALTVTFLLEGLEESSYLSGLQRPRVLLCLQSLPCLVPTSCFPSHISHYRLLSFLLLSLKTGDYIRPTQVKQDNFEIIISAKSLLPCKVTYPEVPLSFLGGERRVPFFCLLNLQSKFIVINVISYLYLPI